MRLREWIRVTTEWTKRVVTEPRGELTRWQRRARDAYDLGRHGALQLRQDNAPQMAGALAFRTLFGMLPVIIVGTILVRAFRGAGSFHKLIESLVAALFDEQAGGEGSLSGFLIDMVSRAENVNLTALGWVGSAVLIYSAISLMVTIENSFNTIYRAAEGRNWLRRLPVYWTVLTLGPLALGLMFYVNAQLQTSIASIEAWHWLLTLARDAWGFAIAWLLMLAVYQLLPATRVSFRPALIGAFVAALLLTLGQHFLGAYMMNMQSIQLWGPVGLVPLFMFWVYVMWLAVLFGLEVSATLQLLGGRRLEDLDDHGRSSRVVDPTAVVPVMAIVAEHFRRGEAATTTELSRATGVPEATVHAMLDGLAKEGFVRRLLDTESAVMLARPPDQITADALIAIGWRLVATGEASHSSALLERLRSAQSELAAGVTLAQES